MTPTALARFPLSVAHRTFTSVPDSTSTTPSEGNNIAKPAALPPQTETNPQAELAFRFITQTNQHVYLTGRAGTGKTTFLHRVVEQCMKQLVVVAPTGVAAINAKGVTIHSMFQLPFGLLTPDQHAKTLGQRKLGKEKQRVLQSLDLLIIDEISMVRADVLDAIDWTLRRYRNPRQAFGGVQLLMIGDLHQLPPVVKDQEQHLLRQHYQTPYFFSSQALQRTGVQTIELTKIYRQRDDTFVQLLNDVRSNKMTPEVLEQLNARFRENIKPGEEEGVITLTSHRNSASEINRERLTVLPGKTHTFTAKVQGKFPEHAYPTVTKLELKIGAQVMFVKNDPPPERSYFNGKIGRIEKIDAEGIVHVRCEGDAYPIEVGMVTWENKKYKLNEQTKEVAEGTEGTFMQVPLRLAWAITIHKSQGLTFDKVIIDAQAAFAHGQVYVALSRCRTLEGIRLLSQIQGRSVRTDSNVNTYTEAQQENPPTEAELTIARQNYHRQLVSDVFDFRALHSEVKQLLRFYIENENSFATPTTQAFEELLQTTEAEVFQHAKNFLPVLNTLQKEMDFSGESVPVHARAIAAANYFKDKLDNSFTQGLRAISFNSDNKSTTTRCGSHRKDIAKFLRVATVGLDTCIAGDFDAAAFVRKRVSAGLGDAPTDGSSNRSEYTITKELPVSGHPELYKQLHAWRKNRAATDELSAPSNVTTIRSLIAISNELPITKRGLKNVSGVGKKTMERYGEDILNMVVAFCNKHELKGDIAVPKKKDKTAAKGPSKTTETKRESLEQYKAGKSVEAIAEERNLKSTTIYGHLAHFVVKGDLPIGEFLSPADVEVISYALKQTADVETESGHGRLSATYEMLEKKYSYGHIRMVLGEA